MFENIGHGLESSATAGERNRGAAVEVDAIREQQPKQTQSGSTRNGRNRGAATEADALIGEQQLKLAQTGSSS